MVPSVRFPVQNVLVSKYLRSNKTDVYIYMTVNLYSTKAEFPIPNNTLYSLALLYNKWQNCAKKKKRQGKTHAKNHSLCQIYHYMFFFSCSAARCIALYYQIDRSSVISTFTILQQQIEI